MKYLVIPVRVEFNKCWWRVTLRVGLRYSMWPCLEGNDLLVFDDGALERLTHIDVLQ